MKNAREGIYDRNVAYAVNQATIKI